jgi:twitching motility protein PilT
MNAPAAHTWSAPTSSVTESHSAGLMRWVAKAASCGATALYLRAGAPPVARVEERLESLGSDAVDASVFEQLLMALDSGVDRLWQPGADGEWIRNEDALGRVSCKFFTDDLGPGLVVRLRRQLSSSLLHRHIPRKVKGACDGDGLIVVSAATPTDLLAIASAVADYAGRRRGGYVIALRPEGTPRHDITGAFVSQRELSGSDADIAAAIRNAGTESPDVLLVAPPHSETAMREVVHATDGGRLVILAILAPTSMHALRAISGRSATGGDAPNRLALATSFRAAFSYRGMRRLGGGRTLIQDLLIGTSEVSALLASGDFAGITRIQRSGSVGMHTMDETLARAVKRGHLSLRQAAAQAVDRRHLISVVRAARRASSAHGSDASSGNAPVLLEDLLQAVGSTKPGSRRRWSDD